MMREESDSMGSIQVPKEALWGAQTQRSLEHFSISEELIPREMIPAYALFKKACALANHELQHISLDKKDLIVQICDEILSGQHADQFPLHVWMTGSGTQFNMNMNEVIANRASQIMNEALGSKKPLHPNDHVNMSQSSNDSFPSVMYLSTAIQTHQKLLPSLSSLVKALKDKVLAWKDIVKIGRTHMQDAVPITLGQEFSAYVTMLEQAEEHIRLSLNRVYELPVGGTAVGTGLNAPIGFDKAVCLHLKSLTNLPIVPTDNKFAVQGAHDALVFLSGSFKSLAVSLYKMANDIRLLSCGPRAGFFEIIIPENEPGSSIMPGKVNPTQCEAMTMAAIQVMANDVAIGFGGASGYLEMNVYKPLMIHNIMQSIRLLSDTMHNFEQYLILGAEPNHKRIAHYLSESLMLGTALSPVIGYDKASEIAHYAYRHDIQLKQAALALGYISEADFDAAVDPKKMV